MLGLPEGMWSTRAKGRYLTSPAQGYSGTRLANGATNG